MEEKKMITLTLPNGATDEVELLTIFKLNSTQNQYMVYTHNEVDENNLTTIHISRITVKEGKTILEKVENDQVWAEIKSVLKEMIVRGDQ